MILRLGPGDIKEAWKEIAKALLELMPVRCFGTHPDRWISRVQIALLAGEAQLWLSWDSVEDSEMRIENGFFFTTTEVEELGQSMSLVVHSVAPLLHGTLDVRHFGEAMQAFSNFMEAKRLFRVEWYVNSEPMMNIMKQIKLQDRHVVYFPVIGREDNGRDHVVGTD